MLRKKSDFRKLYKVHLVFKEGRTLLYMKRRDARLRDISKHWKYQLKTPLPERKLHLFNTKLPCVS